MNNTFRVNNLIYKHEHTKNSDSGARCSSGMAITVASKEKCGGLSNACAKQTRFKYHLFRLS